ncbi:TetR/AcrR family transcriptional regulator [Jatrophihabitans sp. DSM 45814]
MTTPAPDRRQQRRGAKLAVILDAAWTLARRDGLAAISLRDLADAVGLRQPSLYVYFDSKLDLYDAMFADGWRQFLDRVRHDYPGDPHEALTQFVGECVQFSSDDVVRHQLLLQRTIPGFEPSPESLAVAMEFYELGSDLTRRAGVHDPTDIDMFTAIVTGLAHQQVANDPGGTRWVRLADRTVEMFLNDVQRRPQTGDPSRTRRKTPPV